jgi:hypothetical protein
MTTRVSPGFLYRTINHAALTLTFKQSTLISNTTYPSDGTITFSAQAIGTADPQRFVFITFCAKNPTNTTLSSVTIGGVAATFTFVGTTNTPANNNGGVGFAFAYVPAGTTADVVFTWSIPFTSSSTAAAMAIHLYTVVGPLALTPTVSDDQTSGANRTVNYTIPAGGIAVSIMATAAVAGAVTGNMTLDVNGTTYANGVERFVGSQSNGSNVNALTAQSITFSNVSSSGQPGSSCVRVFGRT